MIYVKINLISERRQDTIFKELYFQVDFKVPKIECFDAEEIPYTDCVDAEKVQMTTSMVCKVSQRSISLMSPMLDEIRSRVQ